VQFKQGSSAEPFPTGPSHVVRRVGPIGTRGTTGFGTIDVTGGHRQWAKSAGTKEKTAMS
jgi:hypothetical protein